MKLVKGVALLSSALLLAACGSDNDSDSNSNEVDYPSTYSFESKVVAGESSVVFTGQAARQLLIDELKKAVGAENISHADLKKIYTEGTTGLKGADIYDDVNRPDTAVGVSAPEGFTLAQAGYDAVYGTNDAPGAGDKKLSDKTAGCDNNLSASQFIGWDVTTLVPCKEDAETTTYHDSAYSLILEWLPAAATNKVDAALGLDYQQLLQKFLLGAVAFSQTAEDYLAADHAKDKKGLKATNVAAGDAYTSLEHAWDEGFGYFGASVDYLNIDDATIATDAIKHSDVNGDTKIDLLRGEYNYGLAVYASKHDVMTGTTDLSKEIMVAFLEGRQLITDNHGTTPVVGDALHTQLAAIADRAVKGMEKVIAISVIKYINQTIGKLGSYTHGQSDGSVIAKPWSELKGFALGLQFNLNPVMDEAKQIQLHNLIGQSPVAEITNTHGNDKASYITALESARTLVQEAYDFDATEVVNWK